MNGRTSKLIRRRAAALRTVTPRLEQPGLPRKLKRLWLSLTARERAGVRGDWT